MALKTPIINIMTKAAYKAGNILIKDFREVENLQVSKKGIGDFVTSADLNSEKTIIKILQKAYPEIKIFQYCTRSWGLGRHGSSLSRLPACGAAGP